MKHSGKRVQSASRFHLLIGFSSSPIQSLLWLENEELCTPSRMLGSSCFLNGKSLQKTHKDSSLGIFTSPVLVICELGCVH